MAMNYWKKKLDITKKKKNLEMKTVLLITRLIDFKFRDINDELVRKQFLKKDLGSLLKNCKG